MLIGNHVIFVFRVRGLVMWRDVDFFERQGGGASEFFEEVGDAGFREVDVCMGGIFGLGERVSGYRRGGGIRGKVEIP